MKDTLTQQLEKALQDVQYWRGKYEAAKEQLLTVTSKQEDEFSKMSRSMERQSTELFSANQQLMEVVRWHINPETAKSMSVCQLCNEPLGYCKHTRRY